MLSAMTAAQARLADTIDVFYGAADKTSEGAMAAHAYKRAVEELDTGIGREMVRPSYTKNPPAVLTEYYHRKPLTDKPSWNLWER